MVKATDVSPLDLAALLCSRVCHDIISPVGAINNGLEVLEEDSGGEMEGFAMELIRKSAKQASNKLQFARLAFGAAGSAGAEIDTGDAEKVAQGLMEGEKPSLTWTAQRVLMAKNRVKLLLNLILIASSAIPRGGNIDLTIEGEASAPNFRLVCTGPNARVPADIAAKLAGDIELEQLDAHIVQPVYAGMLARSCNMTLSVELVGESVEVVARSVSN
ncbi:MAG: histidine phosphotransferase [Hyphomicrobiales bacterium]|nr:MAG: histidine phosphotransferase [Hyphomicrobiales bacterium]